MIEWHLHIYILFELQAQICGILAELELRESNIKHCKNILVLIVAIYISI